MSDRCYMEVRCRRVHAPIFEKMGFVLHEENYKGVPDLVELMDEEANYAHYDDLKEAKVPFFGWHGEGGGYGSMAFACDGQTLCYIDLGHGGEAVVPLDAHGRPAASALKDFKLYQECECRAKKVLGIVKIERKKRGKARARVR